MTDRTPLTQWGEEGGCIHSWERYMILLHLDLLATSGDFSSNYASLTQRSRLHFRAPFRICLLSLISIQLLSLSFVAVFDKSLTSLFLRPAHRLGLCAQPARSRPQHLWFPSWNCCCNRRHFSSLLPSFQLFSSRCEPLTRPRIAAFPTTCCKCGWRWLCTCWGPWSS